MMLGRNVFLATSMLALLTSSSAFAFSPTATTSPGYDRALAESRKARQMTPDFIAPAPRHVKPRVHGRRLKRY